MGKNNRLLNSAYLAMDGLMSGIFPRKKPHILIACMPKSASTFLASAISELPGFRRCRLTPDWGAREQELSAIRLSRYNHSRYVSQHHLRCSAWTQQLIQQYNLTPVVLVRNLADCTISIRDHFRREPGAAPMAYFDKSHLAMSDSEFEDAIVRLNIPWYLNFYASWKAAGDVPIYDFDEYTEEPVRVMSEILARASVTEPEEKVAAALERVQKSKTRFNVGETERGRQLSDNAKESLARLLEFYPDMQNDPLFVKTRETISGN